MTITLTVDQEIRLSALVASGDFPTVEAAVQGLLDERLAQLNRASDDDLAWAKPLVDEALDAMARVEVLTLAEHRARNDQRLATLRKA